MIWGLCLLIVLSQNGLCQLSTADKRLSETDLFEKFRFQMEKLKKWRDMTKTEKQFRFKVFKDNLKIINRNVKPERTKDGVQLLGYSYRVNVAFTKQINKFTFLSTQEFDNLYMTKSSALWQNTAPQNLSNDFSYSFDFFLQQKNSPGRSGNSFSNQDPYNGLNSFNYRVLQSSLPSNIKPSMSYEHLFNPVFDQGDCNSCYIASSLNTIEVMFQKKNPGSSKISLSLQEILDCSKNNVACRGGQPAIVFDYVMKYGISFTEFYKYEAKKNSCRADLSVNTQKIKRYDYSLNSLDNFTHRILQYNSYNLRNYKYYNNRSSRRRNINLNIPSRIRRPAISGTYEMNGVKMNLINRNNNITINRFPYRYFE